MWGHRHSRLLLWALLLGGATSLLIRSGVGAASVQPELHRPAPESVAAQESGLALVPVRRNPALRTLLVPWSVEPAARAPRVRVQGRVYHCGRALAGCELTFHPASPDPHPETDWDITDDDGYFEVLLPAASYTVQISARRAWSTNLLVPSRVRGLDVDFNLPPAAVDAAGR